MDWIGSKAIEKGSRPLLALPALSPRAGRWLGLAWRAFAVVALLIALIGLWRGWAEQTRILPPFVAMGLEMSVIAPGEIEIAPLTDSAARAGLTGPAILIAVAGRPITADLSMDALAATLRGPDGPVRLSVRPRGQPTRDLILERRAETAAALYQGPKRPVWRFVSLYAIQFVSVLGLLAGGLILIERRPGDPVSVLLAYSFVCGATALPLTSVVFEWLALPDITGVTTAAFFALLLVAMPVFPDGRFVPRAGLLVAALAPVLFGLIVIDALPIEGIAVLSVSCSIVAAAMPVLRFRRSPPGIERQQLKWAALGFFGAFAMLAAAVALVLFQTDGPVGAWMFWFGAALFSAGFLLLPAGVLVSLLRYRLWDADRAIGRSSMFGIVTLTLGGIWAGVQEVAKVTVEQVEPDFDPAALAAVATALVAILFPPIQSRVEGWTRRRLEPRLERLRTLPATLGSLGARASVAQIAEIVVNAAVDAAASAGGALLVDRGGQLTEVASRGDRVGERSFEFAGGHAVLLRLAPRPDGTPLPGGVRALLAELEAPMAEAFGAALAREDQARTITMLGARIEALTARVDAMALAQASSSRTSSMKRSTEIGLET